MARKAREPDGARRKGNRNCPLRQGSWPANWNSFVQAVVLKMMTVKRLHRVILGACAILLLLAACTGGVLDRPGSTDAPPTRFLLIGNSFTFFHRGIDKELKGLAPSSRVSAYRRGRIHPRGSLE